MMFIKGSTQNVVDNFSETSDFLMQSWALRGEMWDDHNDGTVDTDWTNSGSGPTITEAAGCLLAFGGTDTAHQTHLAKDLRSEISVGEGLYIPYASFIDAGSSGASNCQIGFYDGSSQVVEFLAENADGGRRRGGGGHLFIKRLDTDLWACTKKDSWGDEVAIKFYDSTGDTNVYLYILGDIAMAGGGNHWLQIPFMFKVSRNGSKILRSFALPGSSYNLFNLDYTTDSSSILTQNGSMRSTNVGVINYTTSVKSLRHINVLYAVNNNTNGAYVKVCDGARSNTFDLIAEGTGGTYYADLALADDGDSITYSITSANTTDTSIHEAASGTEDTSLWDGDFKLLVSDGGTVVINGSSQNTSGSLIGVWQIQDFDL